MENYFYDEKKFKRNILYSIINDTHKPLKMCKSVLLFSGKKRFKHFGSSKTVIQHIFQTQKYLRPLPFLII